MATSKERLRRLLSLVPYIVNHPGVEIADLSKFFGAPEKELKRDLELLFMTGIPPYGPGDLIDVTLEDGRVWLQMADHFNRPQRLTRPEAVSLYLRGEALLGTPGYRDAPALASALSKLEEGLGPDALGDLRGRVERAETPPQGGSLEYLWQATADHERVDIVYFSASSDSVTNRRIDPEKVFSALGYWYVVAWDEAAGGERIFRVDRVRSAAVTGERFQPRGLEGAGRPMYARSEADMKVELRLHPEAFWVAEYYETESVSEHDGMLEVTMPTRSLAWVAKLLVRLGGAAEIVEPDRLKDEVRDLAERALALYRS